MSQVHFLDLFLGYEPPEAIRAEVETLAVEHAGIDREARTISLRLSSGVYITEALLGQMASELEARYGLRRWSFPSSIRPRRWQALTTATSTASLSRPTLRRLRSSQARATRWRATR